MPRQRLLRSFFAEEPTRSADTARIFWPAAIDPAVIPAAASAVSRADRDAFNLDDLSVPASILTRPGLGEEIVLTLPERSIRLSIRSGTTLAGPVRLTFRLSGFGRLSPSLAALQRLLALRTGQKPPRLRLRETGVERRILMLRTLNALAANAQLQAVAIALYGEERVARDWNSHSDFLKSRVRRLIAHARYLTDARYLTAIGELTAG